MIARLFPLIGTGSLIALVGLLGFKAHEASQTKIASPKIASTQNVLTPSASPTQLIQRPAVYYATITNRPVFAPSRRPYVPEIIAPKPVSMPAPESVEEAPKPAQQIEIAPPEVVLQGVIARDERTAALIGINGESPAWVGQGDQVAGWTLSDIGSDWIEISREARSIRVGMYK